MSYVVAVHGDDSRTVAVALSFDGRILAKSSAGPCIPSTMTVEETAKLAYFVITDLLLSAKLSFSSYGWMSIAIDGLTTSTQKAQFLSGLSGILGPIPRVTAYSAQEAAYAAVFPEGGGILVSIGTGSNAYAVKNGEEVRAGGWGYMVDDEGGGYWLGAKALAAAMQSYDGRMPGTPLLQMTLKWLSLQRVEQLADWFKRASVKDVASIATLVLGAARSGDKAATNILREGARELAKMVWAVWERTDIRIPVEVAFTGELVREDPKLAQLAMDELGNLGLEATARVAVYSSLWGAAVLALRSSGVAVSQQMMDDIRSSLESILQASP